MTTLDPETEQKLRLAFRQFNRFMLLLWRLGLGAWINVWPSVVGRIMVINHIGRRTGLRRQTPVNYAVVDGELYCTAAFGGYADWYRNIKANPNVQVWLPDGWWSGTAEDVSDREDRISLMRQVLIGSGIVAPLIDLDPRKLTDEELDAATSSYSLIHIRRDVAQTGPEGPGDLAWVWPLATMILAPLALLRRRR